VETDEVTIRISRNGPYHVTGKVKLVDHKGNAIENDDTRAGEFWLCRCGGSKNKPFCDSTHSEIGFKGAIAAVAAADAAQAEQ
jgi:CDGSH-type Zn-finger protein